MDTTQRTDLGYGNSPEQIFAAAGMNKVADYDMGGMPMQPAGDAPAPSPSQAAEPEDAQNITITAGGTSEPAPPVAGQNFDLSGKFNGKFSSLDEIESYVSQLEEKANKDPFANDLIRDLNKAIAEGVDPDLYMAVSRIDAETLSERDALILELQWKNGLTAEDAEFMVSKTYRLSDDGDELDMSDPDVREAQIKLRVDGQKAKDFLSQYKQDALTPPIEKQIKEVSAAWNPVIPQVLNNWKSFTINSKTGTYQIPTSDAAMKAAESLLRETIETGLFDSMPDKDGMAIANAIVEKEIMKHDLQHAVDYVADTLKTKQLEEKHNPRKPVGADSAPIAAGQDDLISWLKKVRG